MDINNLSTLMEQYKLEGGDMNAAMNLMEAMSATEKTSLGLNQWVKSDKPTMDEFNEDNRIIDREICALNRDKVNKDTELTWYKAELLNGYTHAGDPLNLSFSRDNSGTIYVNGLVHRAQPPNLGDLLFVLPEGFHPNRFHTFIAASSSASDGASWATYMHIHENGSVYFTSTSLPINPAALIAIATSFKLR